MSKKSILLTFFLLLFVGVSYTQQDMLLTHFIYNKMGLNPGSTGIDEGFCATSAYRNQWDKIDGAPNSAILNLEGNMNRFFPGGLGLNFYHDAIGFGRQNNLMVNYSYPVELPSGDKLGIGIGVGFEGYGMKPTWVTPDQSATIDNSLPTGYSSMGLDMNFGLYYKSTKNFYVGLSSTHITATELSNKNPLGTASQKYLIARHYYLMTGYKKQLGTSANYLDFQVLLKSDAKKSSVDINTRFILGSIGYAGLTYRTSDAVAIMLGFNPFNNFTVGYSYDLTLNKLSSISRGSHEILLKYCYFLPIPPVAVSRHPRWL